MRYLPFCLALVLAPVGGIAQNISETNQTGTGNTASTTQSGHNFSMTIQHGANNVATTVQDGVSNLSAIAQVGEGHSQTSVQTGGNHQVFGSTQVNSDAGSGSYLRDAGNATVTGRMVLEVD